MKMRFILSVLIGLACTARAEKINDFKPLDQSSQSRIIRFFDFDKDDTKWAKLPANYRLLSGEGVNGSGALTLARSPGEPYAFASCNIRELTPGLRYRLSAMVKIAGLIGVDGKPPKKNGAYTDIIGVDFSSSGKYVASAYIRSPAENGECDWTTVSTEFMVPPKCDNTALCFFLKPQFSCSRIAWDNVKIEFLGETPPVLYPVLPKQLRLDKTGRVKLRVADFTGGKQGGLSVYAQLPDGRETEGAVNEGFAEILLGELPPGMHSVNFVAVDLKKRQIIAKTSFPFTVTDAVPPVGGVDTDESGRLLVDGKPFLPIGFFLEQPADFTPNDLARLREAGVNTLLPYRSIQMRLPENRGNIGLDAVQKSLDWLHQNDIKVIFSLLEIIGRTHKTIDSFDGITDKNAIARHLVNGLKNHPALLGWYISDENPVTGLDPVRDLRYLVSGLDPFHPVSALTNLPENYVHFGPTGDFMMIDNYPVVNQTTQSMSRIRECFDIQERDSRLGVWIVPQAFNWGVYRRSEKYDSFRYPTEQEMRSHSLLALNRRARAVCFYAYDSIKRQEKLDPGSSEKFWPHLANVVRLIHELTPFYLADAAPSKVNVLSSSASYVEAMRHTVAGRSIIVVTADGPGTSRAILDIGKNNLKSRFGLTRELGDGKYEFEANNTASDILE